MTGTEAPRVSVVVPALDEEANLDECLTALAAQDYPADRIEILVVDGGSIDATAEIIARFAARDPRFRRLLNPTRHVSAALNLAIAAATGSVLLRVDAHALAAPDYVRRSVEALAASGAAVVGGPMQPEGRSVVGRAVARAMLHPFGVGTARFRFARTVQEVDTVYLGAFPLELFERVGTFNETLVRNQDYEMNWRIRCAGGRVVVDPAIRVVYITRSSLATVARQYASYGYWKFQMLRLHPRSLRARQLAAPSFVVALGLAAAASVLALAGSAPAPLAWALPAVAGAYAAANLAVSLALAARHGARLALTLPPVFATLHLAWGAGFLAGILRPAAVAPARGRL
ncbi:MAG: glycosyltransferase family 2 protein [Thermoanaerobaculia bacterium]